MPHPQDFNTTRIVHRRTPSSDVLPSLAVPNNAVSSGIYKNELVIDSRANIAPGSNPVALPGNGVNETPGIYLRVGSGTQELTSDQLIRIGPAIVTNDPTSATAPTTPYDDAVVLETGTAWLRKTDGVYFVHNGDSFIRVTPFAASTTQSGVVRLANDIETLAGVSPTLGVTPSSLANWANAKEVLYRKHGGRQIYVNQQFGDDSLKNDGNDEHHPFLTINRALLEVARRSFVAGFNNDIVKYSSIVVAPGDYVIDNRPGSSNYALLPRNDSSDVTINAQEFDAEDKITAVVPEGGKVILTVPVDSSFGLLPNTQIWNQIGSTGIIDSVTSSQIVIRNPRGAWAINDIISFADYSVFNSTLGGAIVPRGCSIRGTDLRKVVIRPRYLGDFDTWSASIAGCTCSYAGGTAIFKLTGSTYITDLTFNDHVSIKETHHLCTAFEFASEVDLNDAAAGYYKSVYQVLGNTVNPAIVLDEFQANSLEFNIVSNAINNNVTDGDGFRLVDGVSGSSPYIYNCSLLSRFGLRGVRVDGSVVGGLNSMVVANFTNVTLQNDERAFTATPDTPGDKSYKPAWAHTSYEAVLNGYMQLVNCFTVCSANHYRTLSGGELCLNACVVNFGDIAFTASGHSTLPLAQDTGTLALKFVPPQPIAGAVQELPLGTFKPVTVNGNLVLNKIYVQDDLDEGRITPFSITPNETIYVRVPRGSELTAKLLDSGPYFGTDANGSYIIVSPITNDISTSTDNLDSLAVYIKRQPDLRQPDDRIYWLEVSGIDTVKRPPQRNYVLQLVGAPLTKVLFVADVRDTLTDGTPLPDGTIQIALLSGEGANDNPNLLYPELNVNFPEVNSPISKTYLSLNTLMEALGLTELERLALLVPAIGSVNLPSTLNLNFLKPSTIRAFGTGMEFIGHKNYSTGLPQYQDYNLNVAELFAKIKQEDYGGRVYNIGLTHDGLYIVGDRIIDLRDGSEINATNPFADRSTVFKNITVTNRTFLYPSSIFDINGVTINLDINTSFGRPITSSFSSYASTGSGGFIRLASQSEANSLTSLLTAITPGTLPKATFTQQGISRYSTISEANALTSTNTTLTPGTLPFMSGTQRGVVRAATPTEANSLALTDVALTPGTLPIGSETQRGAVEFADVDEANALNVTNRALSPGRIPKATTTQEGVSRFATTQEVDNAADIFAALKPSQVKRLIRLMKEDEIGTIRAFAGSIIPDGWLRIGPQPISRTVYAKLFGVIGTVWGVGDGVTTFNLPPAERCMVGASDNPGYVLGTLFGAATATSTSANGGIHTHTGIVDEDGEFSPTAGTASAGGHTPVITMGTAGEHSHSIAVNPGGAVTPTAVSSMAGAHTPIVQILVDGGHSHTITVAADGAFTPTVKTISAEGGHTHSVTTSPAGGHDHSYSGFTNVDAFALTGFYTGNAGDVLPIVQIGFGGSHTHILSIQSAGLHTHDYGNQGDFLNDEGGDQTGVLPMDAAGLHSHTGTTAGGDHSHSVNLTAPPPHSHSIPTMTIPGHTHTFTINNGGSHFHETIVNTVASHIHSIVMNPIPAHFHNATSATAGAHSHSVSIAEVPDHLHTITVNPIPAHVHTATSVNSGIHLHQLNISPVLGHTHEVAVSPIPGHRHSFITAEHTGHTHVVTSSTLQPSMAINFIIYTGVFSS